MNMVWPFRKLLGKKPSDLSTKISDQFVQPQIPRLDNQFYAEDSVTGKWFLMASERGNSSSNIDARYQNGKGWTEGNSVTPLVHGSTYFKRLHSLISCLQAKESAWFLGWRMDPDELLDGPGTELREVLASAARKGVDVRGLLWRSHSKAEGFSKQQNATIIDYVNHAGGELLPDERVRRFGSHHQKIAIIRHPENPEKDLAFVGGLDLCHGRRDDARHLGDPQSVPLYHRYGTNPSWHDIQLEIRGPTIGDVAETFRERWADPTPLQRENPFKATAKQILHRRLKASELADSLADPPKCGNMDVQILRTYPYKRSPYPFAPEGERSVALAYKKALARARSLIYVEDQYLWSRDVAKIFADALRASPQLLLIAVVPRYPDRDGRISGPLNRIGQQEALALLKASGGDRVAIYDIENELCQPIYVHGKLCIIDDVWMSVGSDNLNRRSWTHDSEASCAVIDHNLDLRSPQDPAGLGDGARVLPRNLRLTLWHEHLGEEVSDYDLIDPVKGFASWKTIAHELEAWHNNKRKGPRPPGRARVHYPQSVSLWNQRWGRPIYRLAIDPDGRPKTLKQTNDF